MISAAAGVISGLMGNSSCVACASFEANPSAAEVPLLDLDPARDHISNLKDRAEARYAHKER